MAATLALSLTSPEGPEEQPVSDASERNAMDAMSERFVDDALLLTHPCWPPWTQSFRKCPGRSSIAPGYMPFFEIRRALRSISCFVATTSAAQV